MEEQPTTSNEFGETEIISQLRHQLTLAEAKFAQIQQEKIQMEVDFEYKRSKIKELYYAKDSTIRDQNSKIFEAGKRISSLESRVKELNEETENIKMIASVSENTKQEAVEDLNKHHQEEIESLRCVLQDTMEEQRRELVLQFEEERRRWEEERRKWEEGEKEREKGKVMEQSMMQAQNEAEKLKEVVLPLEEEIAALKQRLEKSNQQFQQINQQNETLKAEKLQNDKDPFSAVPKNPTNTTQKSEPQTLTHDDSSFGSFQSHPIAQIQIQPDSSSLHSGSSFTESQDSISVTSVNSMPGTLVVENNDKQPNRVLSAPNLQLISSKNEQKSSKAWDEITDENVSPEPVPSIESTLINDDHDHLKKINKDLNLQISKLQSESEKLREQLESEVKQRLKVEESVMRAAEDCQQQISDLCSKVIRLETLTTEAKKWRDDKEEEDNGRIETVLVELEKVNSRYIPLKKEYDQMRSSFSKYKHEFKENELPKTPEGMKVGLMRYREALIIARTQKDQLESKLQSQLNFLKDRFDAELTAKEQIEESLSCELDEARNKLSQLQSTHRKLEKVQADKNDLQEQMEKDHLSLTSIRTKSKEIINGLKEKLLTETRLKEELEKKLSVCKNQLRSLQDSLETSEQVQRDFVRLSQSLQMKLEDIRQKEENEEANRKKEIPNHNQPATTSNNTNH